jgi:hypothetical protein
MYPTETAFSLQEIPAIVAGDIVDRRINRDAALPETG